MSLFSRTVGYVICVCILFSTSCNKLEFDKIATGAWNPNLAVPLAHANFGIYDILASTDSTDLVVIDPNSGALALVYNGEIFSFDAESFLNIEDINHSKNLDLGELNMSSEPSFNGSITSNNNQSLTFDAGSAELHEVKFKSGTMTLNISSDLAHDLACVITLPEMLKNNTPISTTVSLNYSGTVPHSASATIDLTDVLADFTLANTTFNKMNATIESTIVGSGQPVYGSESIDVDFGFNNLLFENAKGYFNQKNMGISGDTVLLKIFQNSTDGYFELVNPKIRFIANNSFGFPVRLNFSDLKTVDMSNGIEYPLTGFPSVFDISSSSIMGQSVYSEFILNTTNTANLSTVVSSVPKYFIYSANAQSNPDGNVPPLNFITDESQLSIRAEVELPLEGSAYGFELRDTVDFSFNEDVSQLESVMFRLNIDNGFPVELKSQIVFLNENYIPVFTIFNTPESIIESAGVDNLGRVNERAKKITDINLSQENIAKLPFVKYLLINASSETLNGQNGQVIKIYDDYTLDVKLGLQVQGKIQL